MATKATRTIATATPMRRDSSGGTSRGTERSSSRSAVRARCDRTRRLTRRRAARAAPRRRTPNTSGVDRRGDERLEQPVAQRVPPHDARRRRRERGEREHQDARTTQAADEHDQHRRHPALRPQHARDVMDAEVDRRERERMHAEQRTGERVEEVAQDERAERAPGAVLVHAEVDDEDEQEIRRQRAPGISAGKSVVCSSIASDAGDGDGSGPPHARSLRPAGSPAARVRRPPVAPRGRTGPSVTSTSSSRSTSTAGSTWRVLEEALPLLVDRGDAPDRQPAREDAVERPS